MADQERRTMGVEEAGKLLGLSRASSYQAAATGELPTIKIGRRLLVPKAKLRQMLGEPEPTPAPEPAAVEA